MIGKICRLIASVFLIILLIWAQYSDAESTASPEHLIKAAFVYKFAKFVEWPSNVFEDVTDPLTLCMLGEDPMGDALKFIKGKTIKGRQLSVKRIMSVEDSEQCNIIFVSKSEKDPLTILNKIKNKNILSISDTKGFAHRGGIINLIKIEDMIRFEINVDAAQRAKLKISSKLLNLAVIIRNDGRGGEK
ncbi:MAG: YfiR family protein [Planctomycetota bacterium]|jgi:hypothetical protein